MTYHPHMNYFCSFLWNQLMNLILKNFYKCKILIVRWFQIHINYHPLKYLEITIILFTIMSLRSTYNSCKILKFVYLYILFLNFNARCRIKVLCFLLNPDLCFILKILFIFYVFIFEQIHPSIIFQFFQFLFS